MPRIDKGIPPPPGRRGDPAEHLRPPATGVAVILSILLWSLAVLAALHIVARILP